MIAPDSSTLDWGLDRAPTTGRRVAVAILAGLPWILVLSYLVFVSRTPVLIALIALCFAASVAGVRREGARLLRSLGAEPANAERDARLINLAEGLAAKLSIEPPTLWVLPKGEPNSLVCSTPKPALAITRAGLDAYTRTELEAVVAHGLVHLTSGDLAWTTLAMYAPFGRGLAPSSPESYDTAAVALTRYPPALASALRRSPPQKGRSAKLWFSSEGPGQPPVSDRVTAVEDL